MKYTEGLISMLLAKRYCAPEWAYFSQIPNTTGMHTARIADGVAMNLYPSKDHALHCFEIKCTRADFLNEIKDPNKSEIVGKYCDYFTLVIPAGLVDPKELPERWGLLEVHSPNADFAGSSGLTYKRKPTKQESVAPLTRGFVAAILRRACDNSVETKLLTEIKIKEHDLDCKIRKYESIQKNHDETVKEKNEDVYKRIKLQDERERLFKEATGITWLEYNQSTDVKKLNLFLKAATNQRLLSKLKELYHVTAHVQDVLKDVVDDVKTLEKETDTYA